MYSLDNTCPATGEFPHSDICGSKLMCSSPQLFAACHVLLRRLVPRHPPYALRSLIVFRLSILFQIHNVILSCLYNIRFIYLRIIFSLCMLFIIPRNIYSSYMSPTMQLSMCKFCSVRPKLVGSSGLEPPTSRLSGVCSNQLSYEPISGGE